MALIVCPECGKTFSDHAVACPECAFPTAEIIGQINSYNNCIEEIKAEEPRTQKKKLRRIAVICVPILAVCVAFSIILAIVIIPNYKYNKGVELYKAGEYREAYDYLAKLEGYKDADTYLKNYHALPKKVILTYSNGKENTFEFSFDSKGNLIKDNDFDYWRGEVIPFKHSYEYDRKGNIIKDVQTYVGGNSTTYEYVYDINSNLLKEYCDGRISYEYSYDSQGNKIKEVEIDFDGERDTYEYSYDSNGNLLSETNISYSNTEYTYDSKENLIKKVEIDFDGDESVYKYSYDNDGNMIKEVYTACDGSVSTYKYNYDSKGNKIREVYMDSDGDKTTTEYSYDIKGNIKKLVRTRSNGYEMTYEYSDYTVVYCPDFQLESKIFFPVPMKSSSEYNPEKIYEYVDSLIDDNQ